MISCFIIITKANSLQEKYSQPRVKMVKSPWEAALETGYAQKAFEDPKVLEQQQNQHQQQFYQPPAPILTTAPAPIYEPVAPQQQQHYQPPAPQPQAQPKYVQQKPQQPVRLNGIASEFNSDSPLPLSRSQSTSVWLPIVHFTEACELGTWLGLQAQCGPGVERAPNQSAQR